MELSNDERTECSKPRRQHLVIDADHNGARLSCDTHAREFTWMVEHEDKASRQTGLNDHVSHQGGSPLCGGCVRNMLSVFAKKGL